MDDSEKGSFILGLVTGTFITAAILISCLHGDGEKAMQIEAVKNGHAHWKVLSEKGDVQFEWLPLPAEKKQP